MLLRVALLSVALHAAEPIPLHFTPDQLYQSLRTKKPPMPPADCAALGIFACKLDFPTRVEDITLRWVQLDDDPEREAIITFNADAERDYRAVVLDWNKTWNLVGDFWCFRHCVGGDPNFIRVQQLTEPGPILLVAHRDRGGSGHILDTDEYFHLSNGQLHEAFQTVNATVFVHPPHTETVELTQSGPWLIKQTTHEEPPGQNAKSTCTVFTWNPATHTYREVPAQAPKFCNPRTGRRIFTTP